MLYSKSGFIGDIGVGVGIILLRQRWCWKAGRPIVNLKDKLTCSSISEWG